MKNRDLIKKLLDYNLNADVSTPHSEDIRIAYINEDSSGREYSERTTKQIFIEGCDECIDCSHQYINESEDIMWCQHYDMACEDVVNCNVYGDFHY